jgi:hypothetical protein
VITQLRHVLMRLSWRLYLLGGCTCLGLGVQGLYLSHGSWIEVMNVHVRELIITDCQSDSSGNGGEGYAVFKKIVSSKALESIL